MTRGEEKGREIFLFGVRLDKFPVVSFKKQIIYGRFCTVNLRSFKKSPPVQFISGQTGLTDWFLAQNCIYKNMAPWFSLRVFTFTSNML